MRSLAGCRRWADRVRKQNALNRPYGASMTTGATGSTRARSRHDQRLDPDPLGRRLITRVARRAAVALPTP
jgi:hypothetical protein